MIPNGLPIDYTRGIWFKGNDNDVQDFVWLRPGTPFNFVFIFQTGGGGGGGAGFSTAVGSAAGGGGGGASSGLRKLLIPAIMVPRSLIIRCVPGGAGGVATDGGATAGSAGGTSRVYTGDGLFELFNTPGGNGGGAGTAGAGGSGGTAVSTPGTGYFQSTCIQSITGGATNGSAGGATGSGSSVAAPFNVLQGGSGGSGVTVSNTAAPGGTVAWTLEYNCLNAGGVTPGGAGNRGLSYLNMIPMPVFCGATGGASIGSAAGVGGDGGAAGTGYGCGGGGGGAGRSGGGRGGHGGQGGASITYIAVY